MEQKINTKSSMEAKLVGVDNRMHITLWTRNFLINQGVKVRSNVVYKDIQSGILLEKKRKKSGGRQRQQIDIRYFFVMDLVKKQELRIEYCPTCHCIKKQEVAKI
jgi:cytochrome c1